MHCGNETAEAFKELKTKDTGSFEEPCIYLEKGGIIVQTQIGNIQYGIPPETVKDSIKSGINVPEYYIVPSNRFDWKHGMNLMEFEFPVYYNFFIRKQTKTKLICDEETKQDIIQIFQETLLGPKSFEEIDKDFVEGYKGIPDFYTELGYFAKNPFDVTQKLTADMFIDFLILDNNEQIQIDRQVNNEKLSINILKNSDEF